MFLSVMILGVSRRILKDQPMVPTAGPLSQRVLPILAIGMLGPGVALVPLVIYNRYRGRILQRSVSSGEYLIVLGGASVIGALVLNAILRTSAEYQAVLNHPRLLDTTVRLFVPIWIINAVIGTVFARLQRESDTAQEALRTVVHQRRLLLESEERVRSQVAAYLHDRVQTDLVSIALRIRATIGQSPSASSGELTSVIAELERLRSQDVRRASRQLSPNLAAVSLDIALRDLTESYRPAMNVSITVGEAVLLKFQQLQDKTRATGLYRICEQGLLNAAIHGHATDCSIELILSVRNEFVLILTDNGVGLQGEAMKPGMGMTVISAWVEALSGAWSLVPTATGMKLTATVPCA